jgi:hypothetical protein
MSKKEEDKALAQELGMDASKVKDLKKKLAKIEPRSERGVETMFRLLSKNHYTLNTMVDRKSNILISINAIIMSIILGTVMNQMKDDPHLIVPVIMMLLTNLISIVLAVFATRPDFTHGQSEKSVSYTSNPMFFGNFYKMSETDYLSQMRALMYGGDQLYDAISKDTYHLGCNINRKFGLLRKSFNVFVIGITASVLMFIICHVFFGSAFA